jgi:hypothetical protein
MSGDTKIKSMGAIPHTGGVGFRGSDRRSVSLPANMAKGEFKRQSRGAIARSRTI